MTPCRSKYPFQYMIWSFRDGGEPINSVLELHGTNRLTQRVTRQSPFGKLVISFFTSFFLSFFFSLYLFFPALSLFPIKMAALPIFKAVGTNTVNKLQRPVSTGF